MPTDPISRGNSILENILKAMNKQNDLLAAQNKILERMEKHARPTTVQKLNQYLEGSRGELERGGSGSESSGEGARELQGGAPPNPGASVEGRLPGLSGR